MESGRNVLSTVVTCMDCFSIGRVH